MNPAKKGSLSFFLKISPVLVLAALLFWGFVENPSSDHVRAARDIESVLSDAKSVKLSEFIPATELVGDQLGVREMLLKSAMGSPAQVTQLRTAVAGWLDFGLPGRPTCFEPHHRIEVVRADGRTSKIDICFECRGYAIDEQQEQTLPPMMIARLKKFFAAVGMPLRSNEEYFALARGH